VIRVETLFLSAFLRRSCCVTVLLLLRDAAAEVGKEELSVVVSDVKK
jgi:hypothetical protein